MNRHSDDRSGRKGDSKLLESPSHPPLLLDADDVLSVLCVECVLLLFLNVEYTVQGRSPPPVVSLEQKESGHQMHQSSALILVMTMMLLSE